MTSYQRQYAEIAQSLRYSTQRQAAKLERLTAQLDFAAQLCGAWPDRAPEWQALILEAGRLAHRTGKRVRLQEVWKRGR